MSEKKAGEKSKDDNTARKSQFEDGARQCGIVAFPS